MGPKFVVGGCVCHLRSLNASDEIRTNVLSCAIAKTASTSTSLSNQCPDQWFALSAYAFETQAVDAQLGYTILHIPASNCRDPVSGEPDGKEPDETQVDTSEKPSMAEGGEARKPNGRMASLGEYLLWQMTSGTSSHC